MKKMTEAKKSLLLALAGEDCTGLVVREYSGWRLAARRFRSGHGPRFLSGQWLTVTVEALRTEGLVYEAQPFRVSMRITDEGRRVAAELRPARNERPAALDQEPA